MTDPTFFDGRLVFNPMVFAKYMDTVPRVKTNAFLRSGVLTADARLGEYFPPQSGSVRQRMPMWGRATSNEINLNGETDLVDFGKQDSYSRDVVSLGRWFGLEEKDFASDLVPGADFTAVLARNISDIREDSQAKRLFGMANAILGDFPAGSEEAKFVGKHTYFQNTMGDGMFKATTLNSAVQKAGGDQKGIYTAIAVNSEVATNLENLKLVEYAKGVDANGIVKDLGFSTLNGRELIVDDDMPTIDGSTVYMAAKSGDAGAKKVVATGAAAGEINLADAKMMPGVAVAKVGDYVKLVSTVSDFVFTSYGYGKGMFGYTDIGVKVPYEPERLPTSKGGIERMITRYREVMAPAGFSFIGATTSLSPEDSELFTTTNWKLADNGKTGSARKVYPGKLIPIVKIVSLG